MYEIHVEEDYSATLEAVFAAVSDHESLLSGPEITRCDVTTSGKTERNGLGAVREVIAGPLHFVEEVIAFTPPTRYAYKIRSLTMLGRPLRMDHEVGYIELSERGGKVHADWVTRYEVPIPYVGKLVEKAAAQKLAKTFKKLLVQVKGRL